MAYVDNRLIETVVKDIILEYGGISDDIAAKAHLIFNEICEQHREHQREASSILYNNHTLYKKEFNLYIDDNQELLSIANSIYVTLYFYDPRFENYNEIHSFLNDNHLIKLFYSPHLKLIFLTFVWPSNDKFEPTVKNSILANINHEVKHAFQSSKRKSGIGVSTQYMNAANERSKPFGFNREADTPLKRIVDYVVPWIYYQLDRDEIDAWMQELYIEAHGTGDIKNTKTYKRLLDAINDYNYIKKIYSTNEDFYTKQNAREYITKSISRIDEPNSYFRLCDRNLMYLKTKLRRVIGRWYEEQGISNGAFKNYSSNEIQQSSPFLPQNKKRRNILKRIFRIRSTTHP